MNREKIAMATHRDDGMKMEKEKSSENGEKHDFSESTDRFFVEEKKKVWKFHLNCNIHAPQGGGFGIKTN